MGNLIARVTKKECKNEKPWKPVVTYTVRNVITNTLVTEPCLQMIKDCPCSICEKVNKRTPTEEEASKYAGLLNEAKRATSPR
jgi:hypothetical protein